MQSQRGRLVLVVLCAAGLAAGVQAGVVAQDLTPMDRRD